MYVYMQIRDILRFLCSSSIFGLLRVVRARMRTMNYATMRSHMLALARSQWRRPLSGRMCVCAESNGLLAEQNIDSGWAGGKGGGGDGDGGVGQTFRR